MFLIICFTIHLINAFDLPAEIRIGNFRCLCFHPNIFEYLGAIFDTHDTLSRQAFEYAVAKINTQSNIFPKSKLVVNQIDTVDALNSFAAYKMGKYLRSSVSIHIYLFFSLCTITNGYFRVIHRSIDTCIRIYNFIDSTISCSFIFIITRSPDEE